MISNSIYSIAAANAVALKEATGKSIMPTGNSVFSNMVGLSYVGSIPEGQEITYGDVLQAVTQDSVDGPSAHSQALGAEVDALIPLVSSHIAFVRNTVLPKVKEFEETMQGAIGRADALDPMESFDITYVNAAGPMGDQDFVSLVERFADDNMRVPATLGYLPALGIDDISKAMMVSSAAVNNTIKQWIAERGEDWLLNVWHHYFATANTNPVTSTTRFTGNFNGIQAQSSFQRLDTSLAVFLIARGLMDEPPEGVRISLNEWRRIMDDVSRWAGSQVKIAARQVDTSNKQEILILGMSDAGRKITVNSTVFNSFVETGGSIEDVLGAALSGKSTTYTLSAFKDMGTTFRDIWNNFKLISLSSIESKATMQLRAEAKNAFAKVLAPVNDDEAQLLLETNQSVQAMAATADKCIDSMTIKDLRCSDSMAIDLIAGIRFAHTPAKQILSDMCSAEKAGCTSPQEAAGMAALNYLCSYAACNLALGN